MPARRFDPAEFLPRKLVSRLTDLRVDKPDLASLQAAKRKRRKLTSDGRLTLLAADHPARMVTGIRDDPLLMGRRHEFLARVARVMASSPFDGVLGTADVLDELLLLEHLRGPSRSFLDGKLMVGSINRGGMAGSAFELDDGSTGYDAAGISDMHLDGAKFLWRYDPEDRGSAKTLGYCVEALRECAERKIPFFLEPLPVTRKDGKVRTDRDKEKLIRLVGAASALGSTSARVWLKLPYCDGFEKVAAATTLPIVLLGGEASDDVSGLLEEIEGAMKAGPNVRGVMMGRNLLYPPGGDPLPLAMAVQAVVHGEKGAKEAAEAMPRWEGKGLDYFASND